MVNYKFNCFICHKYSDLMLDLVYPVTTETTVICEKCNAVHKCSCHWNPVDGSVWLDTEFVDSGGVICPNCGKTSFHITNCEHCGSMLVQFAMRGVDPSNFSFLSKDLLFLELQHNLKKILDESGGKLDKVMMLDIKLSLFGAPFMKVISHKDLRKDFNNTKKNLYFKLPFMTTEQRQVFNSLSSSRIVDDYDQIIFGSDYVMASYIISEILDKVYDIHSIAMYPHPL